MATIKSIYIKNIKAIDEMGIDLNWASILVTGANNSGKSTLLTSFINRIKGEKNDMIVKEWTKNGVAKMELTDWFKMEWQISSDGKETFDFTDPSGFKIKSIKDVRERYFPSKFDIDDFLSSTKSEQLEPIKEFTGLDLKEIEEKKKVAYDERTVANRVRDVAKANVLPVQDLPTVEANTDQLVSEIASIDSHNLAFDNYESRLKEKCWELFDINEQIKKLQEKKNQLEADIQLGEEWIADPKNQKKSYKSELTNKLAEVRQTNEAIRSNNSAIESNKAYEQAQQEAELADQKVKAIEQEIKEMIEKADLPDGFSIHDWGLLYKGLPLDRRQQSSSRIYIAWLILGRLLLWEAQVLHFDASTLDKNSLQEVQDWAKWEWLQLLVERPDFDGGEIKYRFIIEE